MDIKVALAHLDPSNDDHWTTDGSPRMDAVSEFAGETLTRKVVTDAAPDFTRETAQVTADALVESETEDNPGEDSAEATEEGAVDPDAPEAGAPGSEADPHPDEQEALVAALAGEGVQPDPDSDDEQEAEDTPTEASVTEPFDKPVIEAEPSDTPKTELEVLQDRLAEATAGMYAAQHTAEEAKKEADRCSDMVNAINIQISSIEKQDPNHGTKSIRDYLRQQNQNRVNRARGLQNFIASTGVHPNDVAKAVNPSAPIDQAMKGRKPARGSVRPNRI